MNAGTANGGLRTCGVARMEQALKASEQVVDVREPSEIRAAAVEGVVSIPLSEIDARAAELDKARPVYLLCRTGSRARDAACRLEALGFKQVFVVEGGLKEWIEAGKSVVCRSRVWSLERQVRFAAGALVLTGIVLAITVSPYFVILSGFVAAGQIYSACTDTCGMAALLLRAPWNRGGPS
jgi:rhodanese-related sulfurtransferase